MQSALLTTVILMPLSDFVMIAFPLQSLSFMLSVATLSVEWYLLIELASFKRTLSIVTAIRFCSIFVVF